jgi:hypothetical protein
LLGDVLFCANLGLKIRFAKASAGSIPAPGTKSRLKPQFGDESAVTRRVFLSFSRCTKDQSAIGGFASFSVQGGLGSIPAPAPSPPELIAEGTPGERGLTFSGSNLDRISASALCMNEVAGQSPTK